MTCPCSSAPSLAILQAAMANLLDQANGLHAALAGSPKPCTIPDYPEGSTTEQQACAVIAAIDMLLNYIACLNGPIGQRTSCVSAVCETFSGAWNACFA